MGRVRLIMRIIFIYITLAGLVTFSLFICEEAIQVVMFGTWPAKEAQQWNLVLEGTDLMKRINRTARIINWIGWVQPLAFFSYRSYAKSIDYYIKATETEVFVHEPHLMVGRRVEIDFRPRTIEHLENGRWLAKNSKIAVFVNSNQKLEMMHVIGYVKKIDGMLIIEDKK